MNRAKYELFIQGLADAKTPDEVNEIIRANADNWKVGNTHHSTCKSAVEAGIVAMLPAARNTEGMKTKFTVIPSITLPKEVRELRVAIRLMDEGEEDE